MFLSVSNKVEVERQVKRNRIMFWIGVVGLLVSMATLIVSAGSPSLASLVFVIGYPFLILGLVLSKRGAFNNRRHGVGGYKIKSESELIGDEIQGVPPRYHLYNWIKLGDTPIDHLLVTPMGLMIIMAKSQFGNVKAGHDHYRRKAGVTGWFATLGEPGIGQPSKEMAEQVKSIRAWFEAKGYEIPTDGVVVFTNPRTKILGAEEMSFPVCHIHDLKTAIRGWETELNMSVGEQQEIEDLIIQTLPLEVADEARSLAQMPGYKRAALLRAQQETTTKTAPKEKAVAKEKKIEPAVKPKLTPEEREKLRLERIKAAEEKGRQPVNPYAPLDPGKKMGLDGKVREVRPNIIEKKPPRRRVEPLRKAPPGAFGDIPSGSGSGAKKK